MSGVSRKELELLLEFTYTGACQVEVADLKSFLKTGEELGYEGLLEAATGQEIPIFKNDLLKELDKEIRSPKESFSMGQLTKNLTLEVPPDSSEPHLVSTKVEKAADVENADIDVQPHTGELVTVEESVHSSQLDWTLEETFVGNQTTDDKNQATDDEEVEQESESTSTTELEDEHGDVKIENNLTCESCGYTALRSNALTRHQNEMGHFSSRLRFKCKLCPFRANTAQRMYDHKYGMHGEKSFQCDQCPLKFKRKCDLARHTERGHDTFKCKYCDYEAATEKMLEKHVITMQKYNEEAHSRSLDWTLEETFVGNQATDDKNQGTDDEEVEQESESTSATELEDGHGDVKIENKLTCESCGFTALRSGALTRHQTAMGHFSSRLRFKCKLCPFRTNTTKGMHDHDYTVHSEKTYQCDQCPLKYKRKCELARHTERGHDTFKCKYCGQEAASEKMLKMHVITMQKYNEEAHTSKSSHIGKKDENGQSSSKLQFSCNLCPFKTNTTTKIRAHEITKHDKHGGLKFKCDQCDRSYNRKNYLVIHRRNVHDEFKCDYCGHKSRTEKLLKMHIRSMQKLNEEGHF